MREIILDTETTGLDPKEGHRVIEIGCLEILNQRKIGKHFHVYINPNRLVDPGALKIHGLTNDFLASKPLFRAVVDDLLSFIAGAPLVIHNAGFDIGFLDHELSLLGAPYGKIRDYCPDVIDTLHMARARFPGQRNSLDALCKRFMVDNSNRQLHGALLDAELLAEVYKGLLGGQGKLFAELESKNSALRSDAAQLATEIATLECTAEMTTVMISSDEQAAHQQLLAAISKASGKTVDDIWPN